MSHAFCAQVAPSRLRSLTPYANYGLFVSARNVFVWVCVCFALAAGTVLHVTLACRGVACCASARGVRCSVVPAGHMNAIILKLNA